MPTKVGKPLQADKNESKEQGGHFRLQFGIHQQNRLHYVPGEIVPSPNSDLTKHNTDPRQPKFLRVSEDEAKQAEQSKPASITTSSQESEPGYLREDLETMSISDLKELAEAEEVNLAGKSSKKAIIDAILAVD